jgi:iron complex transport system ATP-binding protein
MVIIVTGAIGIGKTTICKKVIEIVRSRRYSCGGIITYKGSSEDIVIEDVQTGEIKNFASTSNIYSGPSTAKYFFNPEGIEFGIRAIEKGVTSDVLVVDELGQLELSGQGFVKVIEQIAAGKIKNCILVIRKSLLSSFIPKFGITTSVFEITINNRNRLPNEISMVVFGNHP